MRRRDFIGSIGATTLFGTRGAWGQQSGLPVIGMLAAPPPPYSAAIAAIRQGLQETGYIEGRNVRFEYRWASGHYDLLPAQAKELVDQRVNVIMALGGAAPVKAAMEATSQIPIVFHLGGDPVRFGFVNSLNRPGGNVTGVVFLTVTLAAKRMELLHEVVPSAKIVGLLTNPTNLNSATVSKDVQGAGSNYGVQVQIAHATTESEIETAFDVLVKTDVNALLVDADTYLFTRGAQIAGLAARHAIPTVYPNRQDVEAGGLISYGASITDAYRLAGGYLGRILKGEKATELPVQQSMTFEMFVNLNAARALGLTIPPAIIARADQVIE